MPEQAGSFIEPAGVVQMVERADEGESLFVGPLAQVEGRAGATLQKATAAALAHTGGGTVAESEVGDDGAAYDVEVRLANGTTVEVQLDAQYRVIGQEADDDGAGGEDEGD